MRATLLFLFVLLLTTVNAQSISGTIKDHTGNQLPGANVYIENTFSGTSSNSNGAFSFPFVDTGNFVIIVEFIGFEDYKQSIHLNGDSPTIPIILKEKFNQLKAVTITAGSYGTGKSEKALVMSSLDMVTTAGSLGDINAAMRSLPGTSNNGESGKLFVHGGEGTETGTYIDGIYVHQPYTSSAPNMAVRGRFNPFMFSGTSFSTGGYSAEYGQALSSVLSMNTNDMPDENSANISIMSIGGDLAATRMWNKGAVTASFNYVNLKPYMQLIPQNYDWNQEPVAYGGKVSFRQKTKGSGMFKFFGSMDQSNLSQYQISRDGTNSQTNTDVVNNNVFVNTNWRGSPSKKWFTTVGTSYTINTDKFTRSDNILEQKLTGNHVKATAKYEATEKIRFRFGLENTYTKFANEYSIKNISGDSSVSFTENISAGFLEAQIYTSTKLLFNAGMRLERSQYLQRNTVSPRLSLAYKLGANSSLSAAYGWFYQNPLTEQLLNHNYLQNEKAEHYILSYSRVANKRTLRSELYYKSYTNLVKYGVTAGDNFSNKGNGYAYGFDFYFKDAKTFKKASYWISYSFLKAERNYRYYPKTATPTFVVPHSVTFVYKQWLGKWRSYVGASFKYGSSRVYNDINTNEFNAASLPSFTSLDLNWSFLFRQHIIFYASVSNVLGAKQVFGYRYDTTPDQNGQYQKTPVLPAAQRFYFVGCFITLTKKGETNQIDKIGL